MATLTLRWTAPTRLRPALSAWDALHRRAGRVPWLGDAVTALLYVGGCIGELESARHKAGWSYRPVDAWTIVLVAAGTAALLVMRHFPGPAVAVTGAVALILPGVGYMTDDPVGLAGSSIPTAGVMVALYALSLRQGRPRSIRALAVTIVAGAVAVALLTHGNRAGAVITLVVYAFVAWALGDAQRGRRAYTASLRARAEELERERHALAEIAVAQERARIARELHDVVAHHVSLMIVNAAAADRQLARDPAASQALLGDIVSTGQAAVAEMRRLLTVLRDGDEDPLRERHPQPTLGDLAELAETFRGAGLRVELTGHGVHRDLPAGVDLTAYRILQESMTNALRHAGAGTRVEVSVDYRADALILDVRDHGTRPARSPAGGSGHGLIGMRERVNLVDGTLRAGPHPDGGFAVHAALPLPDAT